MLPSNDKCDLFSIYSATSNTDLDDLFESWNIKEALPGFSKKSGEETEEDQKKEPEVVENKDAEFKLSGELSK